MELRGENKLAEELMDGDLVFVILTYKSGIVTPKLRFAFKSQNNFGIGSFDACLPFYVN